MRLNDKIKLHIEKKKTFSDELDIVDGEFVIIGVSYGLPHCFNSNSWSQGFNSFQYGEIQEGRPDIVLLGSVYVPTPEFLDEDVVENMVYDNKTVSWEIIYDNPKYTIPGFENLQESLDKLTIRKSAKPKTKDKER